MLFRRYVRHLVPDDLSNAGGFNSRTAVTPACPGLRQVARAGAITPRFNRRRNAGAFEDLLKTSGSFDVCDHHLAVADDADAKLSEVGRTSAGSL
jgi:hypothetical protein